MKKIWSGSVAYIIILSLFLGVFSGMKTKAVEQEEFIELLQFSFDKTEVQPGDRLNFTAKIRSKNELRDVYLLLAFNQNVTDAIFLYQDSKENDVYTMSGHLDITQYYIECNYSLEYFYIFDVYSNKKSYSKEDDEIKNAAFEVKGGSKDVEPPVLKSMTVNKSEVTYGDMVRITAEIEDETKIEFLYIMLKQNDVQMQPIFLEKEEKGKFSCYVEIDERFCNGEVIPSFYATKDLCGNKIQGYFETFTPDSFVVTGASDPVEPPSLVGMKVSSDCGVLGETITLEAEVQSEEEITTMYVVLSRENVPKTETVFLEKIDGKYIAKIKLDRTFSLGIYEVSYYSIENRYGQKTYGYDESLLGNCKFEVKEKVAPTEAPTIAPTVEPTTVPTAIPTEAPTIAPTAASTAEPTSVTTTEPIKVPTVDPKGDKALKKGDSFETSGIKYKILTASNKKYEVALVKNEKKTRTSITIGEKVKFQGIAYTIREISDNAFKNSKKLKKVIIGGKVQKIGNKAFYNTAKLNYIYLETKSLKSIGNKAFWGIYWKAKIKVPRTLKQKYTRLLKGKYKSF